MEYLWKQFEEEFNTVLSEKDRIYIKQRALTVFMDKDIKTYTTNKAGPNIEDFRVKIFREVIKSFMENKNGKLTGEQTIR